MKRGVSVLMAVLLVLCVLPAPVGAAGVGDLFSMNAEIAVFDAATEQYLRSCGDTANLDALGSGEYYTYYALLSYNGDKAFTADNLSVSVDGGEEWYWTGGTFEKGSKWSLHVYYSNMKSRMTEGEHTVVWSVNGEKVHEETFRLVRGGAEAQKTNADGSIDWESALPGISDAEIEETNRTATSYAPYLYGDLGVGWDERFTEYSVDFRADTLPKTTYCCLAHMRMDLSGLKAKYNNVHTEYEGVNMYAGFQRTENRKVAILSFWDIYYDDANGNQQTIRARRIYPEELGGSDSFGGEGTGAHALVPYKWEASHWYRMLLQCKQSPETGNTVVEQWVCDLETGEWTLLCKYDTGLQGSCFTGPVAFFLENYNENFAGEIRRMEVANIRIRRADTGEWAGIDTVSMYSNGGLPKYEGSYAFGSTNDRFWMTTSGVGGDLYGSGAAPANGSYFSVDSVASGSPY